MGIVAEIFGRRRAETTGSSIVGLEAAEEALAKLRRARGLAKAEISQAGAKRRALLLVDNSDREIEGLEKAVSAAELRLDRLDAGEPQLLADLAAARDQIRRAQWAEIRGRFLPAAEKYLSSARAARADLEAYLAIVREAHEAGFASEAQSFFVDPPIVLLPEHLNSYDRLLEERARLEVRA